MSIGKISDLVCHHPCAQTSAPSNQVPATAPARTVDSLDPSSGVASFGNGNPVSRRPIQGSFVVALKGNAESASIASLDGIRVQKNLGTTEQDGEQVTWMQLGSLFKSNLTRQLEQAGYTVMWAEQNYAYEGDVQDAMPAHSVRMERVNDPQLQDQHHLKAMHAVEAWAIEAGSPKMVVAVTDDGTDIDHEDLKANIYVNPREVAGNGVDDDGNGLIDDTHGWNFSGNNKDVRGGEHGTHTAGIIAATANNGKGISGTAPGVKVLPIKWAGDGDWTSAVIVSSYLYAVNQGARIVSTSYNADGWPGDAAIEQALDFMEKKGVLHFNSAGNSGRGQPKRVALKNVIFVASTDAKGGADDDVISSFSNFGAGIDLAAPGGDVLSTLPNNRYGRKSGTSMAAPNAAAVAALVWSKNPDWTREQVYAQVFGTADNIDAKNPTLVGQMGGGRVNALRALTERTAPPTLTAQLAGKFLTVRFGGVFEQKSANKRESWRIERADGQVVSMGPPQKVGIATNELRFNLENLPAGNYRLVASSAHLKDPFGTALAGANGRTGDFVMPFTV